MDPYELYELSDDSSGRASRRMPERVSDVWNWHHF